MVKINSILLFVYSLLFLFSPAFSSATYTHLLWERPINNALNDRDDYYHKVGITHGKATFSMLRTQKGTLLLKEQLAMHIDPDSPWYHFLLGIVNSSSSVKNSADNFRDAMRCGEERPGIMWVLFCEFRQTKQEHWAEICLKQLEKYFFTAGAQSAPVISQQLLAIARQENTQGNSETAEKYFSWSSRFEQYPFWQTFAQGYSFLPERPVRFVESCAKCIYLIKSSWLLQITLMYYFYQWFRFSCIAFICIILLILSIEFLPLALHRFMAFYPFGVTSRLRYFFCVALLLSLSIFGIVPFFLLTALLLWPHAEQVKKVLLAIAVFLLILSPVDARIREMFRVSLSSENTLGLYRRAVSEGWHIDLETRVQENYREHNNDYLSLLSAAIVALKKNSIDPAVSYIQKADSLNPNDPITLITAGNIYFAKGDAKKAQTYFSKCVELFPAYETGLFNLGQLNLSLINTSEGTQQLAKAAELNPDRVNRFIEKNAEYFSNAWPRLRQFMQPDYPVPYFWKQVFPRYCGSWKSTKSMWGSTLFGIPPFLFLCAGSVLFIILLTVKRTSPIENIFFCKLCGNPMCRKCRIGPLCRDCAQATDNSRNETMNKQAKQQILRRRQLSLFLAKNMLNLLIPGADGVYKQKSIKALPVLLLAATSFIYGLYAVLFTVSFTYPFWVIKSCFTALFLCLLLVTVVFTSHALRKLFRELKSLEAKNGA